MRSESVGQAIAARLRAFLRDFHVRHTEVILRFDIRSVDLGYFEIRRELAFLRFKSDLDPLIAMPVHHVEHQRSVFMSGRNVEIRHFAEALALIRWRFDLELEGSPERIVREKL